MLKRRSRTMAACCALMVLAACADRDADQDAELGVDTVPQPGAPAAPGAPGAPETGVVTLSATLAEWSVTLSRDSIPAGPVTIQVRNAGTTHHALEVEGGGQEWETDHLAPGASVEMSLNLAAGDYKVYCPVVAGGVNHEQRGMVTRLRVR